MTGTVPRGRPPVHGTPPVSRRFVDWLDLYGVWVWRLLVLVVSIGGPLVVYFVTIDNRLKSVEQGVSGLDERVSGIESRVASIENRARDIEYRLEDVEEDLGELQESVAALDGKIDRIIIALARTGTDIGSAPADASEPEPAD